MKFTVERNDLLKTLTHVQSVVEKRHSIPILSNVKIVCRNGNITLTTTDMDIAIMDSVTVQSENPGATTIPVHTLYEIVRKLPDGSNITFEQPANDEQSQIIVSVGTSKFTLPCLPIGEFPDFEVGDTTHKFNISSEILKVLLSKTKHAISFEETRYYLNGIYIHPTESNNIPVLRAIATDGHRLARAETALPEGAQDMPGIIIPRKTVHELIKLLEDYVGEVGVSLSNNKITFMINEVTLTSKLIDGKFPDYNRVIPQGNDKFLELSSKDLARSIDLVISISSDRTKAVKLNIDSSRVTLSASSEMNNNATGTQAIDAKYDATPLSIGFNSKYILDSLAAIEGDTVRFNILDNTGAVIAQDTTDNSCMYILMPMQV